MTSSSKRAEASSEPDFDGQPKVRRPIPGRIVNPLVCKRLLLFRKDIAEALVSRENVSKIPVHVPSTSSPLGISAAVDSGLPKIVDAGNRESGINARIKAKRTGLRGAVAAKEKLNTDPDMPCFKSAISGRDSAQWYEPCQEEYIALRNHGTFTLVDRPIDQRVVSAKLC